MKQRLLYLLLLTVAMITGSSGAWADVTPYTQDYETGTADWASGITDRYTVAITDASGNKYLQVSAVGNGNNGTTITNSATNGKVSAGTDFFMSFDMILRGGSNQASSFYIYDSSNIEATAILKLSQIATNNYYSWKINDSETQTISGTDKWLTFEIARKGTVEYLTIKKKSDGTTVFAQAIITNLSTAGGLGKMIFNTKRYYSAMSMDNIVVRALQTGDVPSNPNYTIKYVDNDNTEIKTERLSTAPAGDPATITDADKVAIYANNKKYIYLSDDASGKTVAANGSTVVTVTFREAEKYTATLNLKAGTVNLATVSGTAFENENLTLYYKKAYQKENKWYSINQNSAEPYYGKVFSAMSANSEIDITDYAENNSISDFYEIEALTPTRSWAANGTVPGRYSDGNARRLYSNSYVPFGTLSPGIYSVTLWARNQSGSQTATLPLFIKGTGDLINTEKSFEVWTTAGYGEKTITDITVNEDGSSFVLNNNTGYNSNLEMDYVYITRTGDLPLAKTWVAAESEATGSVTTIVVDDDLTITATGCSVNTSYGTKCLRFQNGGTLKLTCTKDGFDIKKVKLNASVLIGANATWTGNSKEVTFTFTNISYIHSIVIGDDALPQLATATTIADFKADATEKVLSLNNVEVLAVGNLTCIQDATGGMLLNIPLNGVQGNNNRKMTGQLAGRYLDNSHSIVWGTQTDYTTVSVSSLNEATAYPMTVEEAISSDNIYRLVTLKGVTISKESGSFYATDKTGKKIKITSSQVNLEEAIEDGTVLASLTGITASTGGDDNCIIPRSADDIVSGLLWAATDMVNGDELLQGDVIDLTGADALAKFQNLEAGDAIQLEVTSKSGNAYLYFKTKDGKTMYLYQQNAKVGTVSIPIVAATLDEIKTNGVIIECVGNEASMNATMAILQKGVYEVTENTVWVGDACGRMDIGQYFFPEVREGDQIVIENNSGYSIYTPLTPTDDIEKDDNNYTIKKDAENFSVALYGGVTGVQFVMVPRNDTFNPELGKSYQQGEMLTGITGTTMTFGGNATEGTQYEFAKATPVKTYKTMTKGISQFPVDADDNAYDKKQENLPVKGTYYVFEPTKDGQIDATVSLEAKKQLFVTEDGKAIVEKKENADFEGNVSFPVEATKTYYLFANETNLGLYGFRFTPKDKNAENLAKDIATFKLLPQNEDGDTLILKDAVVTYIKGDNVFVEDATGAIVFYQTGIQFYVGQKLNGFIVGKNTFIADDNKLPALKRTENTSYKTFKVTENVTPEAQAIAAIDAQKQTSLARFVKLTDVRAKKDAKGFNIFVDEQGKGNSIRFEDRFNVFYELPEVIGSVQGIVGINSDGVQIFWPTSKDVPEGVGLTEAQEALLAQAKKLAEDREAVAVGLLDDEIEKAEAGNGKGLQAAIDQFNENNAGNAKEAYAKKKATLEELITQAEELIADETMVNAKDKLEAALPDAKAAKESIRLNVAQIEAEVTKLRQAIKAFQEANAIEPTEPEPEVYFSEAYSSTSTVAGWTTKTSGRFEPVILNEDGDYFMSVKQDTRNNNGTTVTGTILNNVVPEGKDFTLTFDARLSSSTNQTATELQIWDASGTNTLLSLKETDKWATTWTLNGTSTIITLPNSNKGNSSNTIADVTWNTYKISTSKGMTYLTITDKATGETIFERQAIETNATGGLGNIVFASSRYLANFAIDNIEVREVAKGDVPDITPGTYMIKYVDEQGATIADAITVNGAIGTEVKANDSQMATIYKDEQKYVYKSGNEPITLSENAEENVITLVYSKANKWNYTVNAVSGGKLLKVINSGTGFEGDVLKAPYPLYVNVGGTLYTKGATNKEYSTDFTLDQADKAVNYEYAATDIEDVIFLTEGEDIEGATAFNTGNSLARSSNAASGIAPADLKVVELAAGTYTINAVGCFPSSGGGTLNITDGTNTLLAITGKSSNWLSTNGSFTLTENTTLYFAQGGSINNAGLDFLYIQSTDGGVIKDINDGKYFLMNIASEMALGAGNNWGTRASLVKHPEYVTLHKQDDGTFQIESQVSNGGNKYYFNGDYMDSDQPVNLTFTRQEESIGTTSNGEAVFAYTIANGDNYFGWDGTSTVLGKNLSADSENALWLVIPEEAAVEALKEATAEDPADATFLFLDPNFSRNNRNKGAWTGADYGVGGDNKESEAWKFNAEKWGGNSQTFDIHQTADAPNGLYKVTWNGFYRYNNTTENTNDVAAAAHADGTEVINSFVYINDEDYPLSSIAELSSMPFSQAQAGNAFANGDYAHEAYVTVTDGKLTLGIKKTTHPGTDWTVWDNFELTYYGPDADVEAVKAAEAEIAKQELMEKAERKLDAIRELVESTNVYTEEAYNEYYGQWLAKYEAGTLTESEVNALQDPSVGTGWHDPITVDNFLLSAWDTNPDFTDAPYYINTWSVEGDNDGTNFRVPFFEYFNQEPNTLAEKTLTATMNGLEAGDYEVSAWVRARAKDAEQTSVYGITLQANDGEAVDVCTGEKVDQFFLNEFTAKGTVGADGVLNIKFNVAADNNIHWLSFKNVKFEKIATEPEIEEGIIYSWESPEGTPAEQGGTIAYVNGDGDRLNYKNGDYYTICLNGKKGNLNDATASANAGHMVVTLNSALKEGDAIAITAYVNKNESKKASAWIVFENGTTAESAVYSDEANIDATFNGVPTTKTLVIPAEAAGSKTITLTRSQTGTNLFITKLEVIRGGVVDGMAAVHTFEDGAIYNLRGQKVEGTLKKGLYIKNGRKVVIK